MKRLTCLACREGDHGACEYLALVDDDRRVICGCAHEAHRSAA